MAKEDTSSFRISDEGSRFDDLVNRLKLSRASFAEKTLIDRAVCIRGRAVLPFGVSDYDGSGNRACANREKRCRSRGSPAVVRGQEPIAQASWLG